MKMLLTSAGIRNPTIEKALVDLLGKPIAECDALCIPTASHGHPQGPLRAWQFISGAPETTCPMIELGWKSVGVLELTALPSLPKDRWVSWVRAADVLLVNGGDTLYLTRWMRESGLAELLPSLNAVYVGLSAGSVMMGPHVADRFVHWNVLPIGSVQMLGWVDFEMFPHVDNPDLPDFTMADADRWAAGLSGPGYAMDDETAIKVVDGNVEVISEGNWKRYTP